MNQQEKIQACVFFLIKMVNETGAGKGTISEENVTIHGEAIGSWRVIIERFDPKS